MLTGQNAVHCVHRSNVTLSDVQSVKKFDACIWMHVTEEISSEQEQCVNLLRECIMLHDRVFTFPDFLQ